MSTKVRIRHGATHRSFIHNCLHKTLLYDITKKDKNMNKKILNMRFK